MTVTTTQLNQAAFTTFKQKNPNFNLASFNFSDENAVNNLKWDEVNREYLLPQLWELQRHNALQRLKPIVQNENENPAVALYEAGLHSCFQIAAMSKQQFIDHYGKCFQSNKEQAASKEQAVSEARETPEELAVSEELAAQAYQRALARASQLTLHYMNLRDANSPHYRALRANNLSRQTGAQTPSLPSYEQLFGGLDFCEVEECRSIFSPVAYLVDLIRFKKDYIDDSQVDEKYKLENRRSDLASIVLNCENTNTPIPQLDIVNKLLIQQISNYDLLAFYPFNGVYQDANNSQVTSIQGFERYVSDRNGVSNSAFYLSPNNNYLSANLNKTITEGNFTLAAWIKLDSSTFTKQAVIQIFDNQNNRYILTVGQRVFLEGIHSSDSFSDAEFTETYENLRGQTWYHIAVTFGNQAIKLYLNGTSVLKFTEPVAFASIHKLSFNRIQIGPTNFLTSEVDTIVGIAVDDACIYQRDLTDQEITILYRSNNVLEEAILLNIVKQNYPLNLPFHLPLEQIRTNLTQLRTSLPDIWRTFSDHAPNLQLAEVDPVDRENLGLSPDELKLYTTLNVEPSQIQEMFGIANEVNPNDVIASLVNISNFLEKTGLTRAELDELLFEDLSKQEITQQLNKSFFINAGENEPIGIAQNKLINLSLFKLDRIHRFIRFAKKIGFSFTDLDWALRTANPENPEIDNKAIQWLAQLKEWQKDYNLSIVELCSFIGTVKDFGKKSGQSFCDRIFNSLNVQNQPTLPDESIKWTVTGQDADNADNRKIKARLAGSLGISENELVAIASKVPTAQNLSDGKLPLSIAPLSALYRLSKIPQVLGMSVSNALRLLELLEDSELKNLAGIPTLDAASTFNKLVELNQWLQTQGISIDQLEFIRTGVGPLSLQVSHDNVINFINSLYTAAKATLITETTLQSNSDLHIKNISGELINFLQKLKDWEYIDKDGIVLKIPTASDLLQESKLASLLGERGYVVKTDFSISKIDIDKFLSALTNAGYIDQEGKIQQKFTDITELNAMMNLDGLPSEHKHKAYDILKQASNEPKRLADTIISLLTHHQQLQLKTLNDHLASLLGVSFDIISTIESWPALTSTKDSPLLQILLQPAFTQKAQIAKTDGLSSQVMGILNQLNRYACLTKALKLTRPELQSIIAHCKLYNINDLTQLTLADVRSLSQFKQLINAFQDRNNNLINLINGLASESVPTLSELTQSLSKLTPWDASQIEGFLQAFNWTDSAAFTVAKLTQLKAGFDLSQKTGLMINSLLELNQLKDATDYNNFAREADSLLAAVKAKYSDTEWATVYEPIHATLNEKKRDALVGYVIYKLQQDGVDVKTPRDIYEYLLIDVEVSGLVKTSVIKEALDCLQLYIYRCQMQLEQAKLNEDGEQFWSWMKNYRVWEANRKTFLYPENYIRPELRKEKTPLFTQLEQALQQTHISEESVDNAVKTYLDSFAEVANLKTVGSYLYETDDPNDAQHPQKNLYLLGRTHTQPYQYYYRMAIFNYGNDIYEPTDWSPWSKIELNIPATYPSPVYAFNKLFIFWVEIKPAPSDREESNGGSGVGKVAKKRFEATVRYSFYNFNKSWVAPQTLGEPILLPVDSKDKAEEYEWPKVFALFFVDRIFITYQKFNMVLRNDLKQQLENLEEKVPTVFYLSTDHLGFKQLPNGAKNYPVLQSLTPVAYYPLSHNNKNICAKENIVFSDGMADGIFDNIEFDTILNRPCCKGNFIVKTDSPLESDYTISVWVNIQEISTNNPYFIIASVNSDANLDHDETIWKRLIFALQVSTGNQSSWNLIWSNISPPIINNNPNFFNEKWQHFVITAQKQGEQWNYRTYLNGEYKYEASSESKEPLSILRLGWKEESMPFESRGYISDLMIFDYLLNTTEIITLNRIQTIPIQAFALSKDEIVRNSWSILDTGKSEYLAIPKESVAIPKESDSTKYQYIRLNSTNIHKLSQLLFAEGIDGLLSIEAQETKEDSFSALGPDNNIIPNLDPPKKPRWPSDDLDFNGANGLYYWELFFHTPFLVANSFNTAQQFELAQKWYHYIFNPTTREDGSLDRYWRFVALRDLQIPTLQYELTDKCQIAKYYEDPFDPHAIAQLRPIAYQKTIVMRYIDNLLDWGDWLFRQDTPETLVEAALLYVTAYDLLGKKPADLGACSLPDPVSLGTIRDKYSPCKIPEFLIMLEQSTTNAPLARAADNPNNYIPGSYFGIPENEQFTQYWNRVIGRLYNIRHNLNIEGIPQNLPLFAPPIDPEQLIQAVASGAGISSAIAGNQAPIPHYRFAVMIEKAKSATGTVIQFGAALLSALEKKDAEQLTALNTTHEQALLAASRAIKQDQLQAAQAAVLALQDGITGAQKRLDHYSNLINHGLSGLEQTQFVLETTSIALQTTAQVVKADAIAGYLIPTVYGLADGDFKPGDAINQGAMIIEGTANIINQQAGMTATLAGYERRAEDWQLQKVLAQADIQQIQDQLQAAQIQVQIAQAEIAVLEKNISQVQEVESFLKTKFTNADLYQWMVGKLSALYFQAYQLAYNLALSAERAWQFERGHDQSFINPGYWDDLHKGLLAGEALMLDLQSMEKAYMDQNARRFEIVKTISLKALDSAAFNNLKTGGTCSFDLDEKLFDQDYPGHYCRQIKSVSISIPAVLGPYQDIHATVTQTSNKTVIQPDVNTVKYLLGKDESPNDGALRFDARADQQIALSQGVNDSGLFELNFYDERYLPFEGTGAVSSWQLEIHDLTPENSDSALAQQLRNSLTGVIIQLRYTAIPGSNDFKQKVKDALKS